MKVLVLGGAGNMARVTVKDLLLSEGVSSVVAADRDLSGLTRLKERINDPRLCIKELDITDEASAVALMKDADVVINGAWYKFNIDVMKAAMKAKVPLLDLGGLYTMTRAQVEMDAEVKEAGILVIPGMGSDPGTSNVLCRHAANKLDDVSEIHIRYGSSCTGQTFGFAIGTVLDEATKNALVLRNGQLVELPPISEPEEVKFHSKVGAQVTYAILHSELATIPYTIPGVKEVTYKDTWDPVVITKVRSLVELGLTSDEPVNTHLGTMTPKDALVGLLRETLKHEKLSPGYDELMVIARGRKDGLDTEVVIEVISAGDPEWGADPIPYCTGIPPSIVAQMMVKGQVKGTGVLPPEVCVDPEIYLKELSKRKIEIYESVRVTRRV